MGCLKKLFKIILYAFGALMLLFVGLIALVVLINNFVDDENITYDDKQEEDIILDDDFESLVTGDTVKHEITNITNIQYAHHHIKWKDYNKKRYSGDIYISKDNFEKAYKNRNGIDGGTNDGITFSEYKRKHRVLFSNDYYTFYWSWVYQNLIDHDRNINDIYTLFDTLQAKNQLNRAEFANILVSAVQFVPYALIHSKTCKEVVGDDYDCNSYSCQYHQNNYNNDYARGRTCLPETEFGLQSPVEFMYNLKGDCDTRSVMAYTILTHYGYDAVVLLSKQYGHSVLGLSIPSNGDFVRHKGKKYYFWEMTAKNWQLGQAPPDYKTMAYWHVAAG